MRKPWFFGLTLITACSAPTLDRAATPNVESPPPTSASDACHTLTTHLFDCIGCETPALREAERAAEACQHGCGELPVTKNRPVVLPSLVGVELGASADQAARRCAMAGGQWSPGYCASTSGPWGLEVDWAVTFVEHRVHRVEVRYPAALCGGDEAKLSRYIAQLVAESHGPPTYRERQSYAWMPRRGVYMSVLADPELDVVRHWVKPQL